MPKNIDVSKVFFLDNGNKFYGILKLNEKWHGLAIWWYYNGFITYFKFCHKDEIVFEFEFKEEAKALTPEPNKPIFSTNQFLELCQRKERKE